MAAENNSKEYGTLYGVGIGPGDPELVTIKAVKVILGSDVLVFPAKDKESCRAYRIVIEALRCLREDLGTDMEDIESKDLIFEQFPMSMNKAELISFHEETANKTASLLREGRSVAFVTLGDPSIYSTFGYIAALVGNMGYKVEQISGITSFCASANRLGISLVEGDEPLHIIPGSFDIRTALAMDGTKVFMKLGKNQLADLKELLVSDDIADVSVSGVSACGMSGESVARSAADISEDWGYLSTVIVKNTEKER